MGSSMMVVQLTVLLCAPAQAQSAPTEAAPAPETAAPAPAMEEPEPAPAMESEPMTPAAPEMAAPEEPEPSAVADPWRVETVNMAATGAQTRVVRSDGSAVPVGAGLADVGLESRLEQRSRRLLDSERKPLTIASRAVAVGLGAAVALAGAGTIVLGTAFWAMQESDIVPSGTDGRLAAVFKAGVPIALTGLGALVLGTVAAAVGGGLWAWLIFRPTWKAPPEELEKMGAALAWDPDDAQDVVARHNHPQPASP